MHKTILTLTTLVLLAPLAAAGPGASVQTLDGDGSRCFADGGSWYGGNGTPNGSWSSWGEWGYAQCDDHYEYAAAEAHDDEGSLARAAVTADQRNSTGYGSNHDSSWEYGWSWDRQSYYGFGSESWSRDASVDTRAGEASASYRCGSGSSHSDSWSYRSDPWGSWSTSDHASAYGSRCGAVADANGETVFVGQRCSDQWVFRSYSASDGTYYWWQEQRASSYGCSTGVDAAPASAGWGSGCVDNGSSYEEGTYAENGTTIDRSYDRSDCATGATVLGPDGAVLFVGQESSDAEWCDEMDGCTQSSSSAVVARLAWEHNPLGPDAGPVVVIPLP